MRRRTATAAFRWAAVPTGEQLVAGMPGEPEEVLEDSEVLKWVIERYGPASGAEHDSPIARWVRNLRSYAEGRHAEHYSGGPDEDAAPVLADIYGARLLARSVRALQHHGAVIHPSLISRELCRSDHGQKRPVLAMPGAAGTLYIAAQCVHEAGGQVEVAGSKGGGGKRPDIVWTTDGSGSVVFERKDRPFRLALDEPVRRLAVTGARRCLRAHEQLPKDSTKLKVGVWGVTTREKTARELIAIFPKVLHQTAAHELKGGEPLDAVAMVAIGYGTRPDDGGTLHAVPTMRTQFFQFANADIAQGDPRWALLRRVFLR